MTIVDVDELVKQQEEFQFRVKGKVYSVPDRSYAQAIKIARLGKTLSKSMETGDAEEVLEKNVDMLCIIVEEFEPAFVKKTFTMEEIKTIFEVINKNQMKQLGEDSVIQKELNYYRKKMGDTYRKNARGAGKKK